MKTDGNWARLKIEEGDSIDFIHTVSSIVNNFCEIHAHLELAGIKIKNWFDHKWLDYSGKGVQYNDGCYGRYYIENSKAVKDNFY